MTTTHDTPSTQTLRRRSFCADDMPFWFWFIFPVLFAQGRPLDAGSTMVWQAGLLLLALVAWGQGLGSSGSSRAGFPIVWIASWTAALATLGATFDHRFGPASWLGIAIVAVSGLGALALSDAIRSRRVSAPACDCFPILSRLTIPLLAIWAALQVIVVTRWHVAAFDWGYAALAVAASIGILFFSVGSAKEAR